MDMTGQHDFNDRLPEVLRMASVLAEQVLDAQIMHRPVPDEQLRALANAALVLEEHGVALPPLLIQVLHEVGSDTTAGDEARQDDEADTSRGLGWLLRPFQGSR